jgi:membrane protein implicated in regulation of membrane protease activity
MEDVGPSTFRRINFALMVIALGGLLAALIVLVILMANAAAMAEMPLRKALLRLAWLAVVCVAMTSLLLVWVCFRYVTERLRPPVGRIRTEYVDAWEEAGRRFRLDTEDEQGEDSQQEESSG